MMSFWLLFVVVSSVVSMLVTAFTFSYAGEYRGQMFMTAGGLAGVVVGLVAWFLVSRGVAVVPDPRSAGAWLLPVLAGGLHYFIVRFAIPYIDPRFTKLRGRYKKERGEDYAWGISHSRAGTALQAINDHTRAHIMVSSGLSVGLAAGCYLKLVVGVM